MEWPFGLLREANMKLIAFDLGASSGKMQLGTFDGERLAAHVIHRFPNRQIDLGGDLYWNLHGIYENLAAGIRKAYAEESGITSIGMDTYCNDFGILGPRGDLLTQMRCYRDPRGARCAEKTYTKISRRELHRMTGNQNAPFNTVMQLSAMIEEGEGSLISGGNTLLLLPDLLGYLLTGERCSEFTVSSVTQMMDYQTGDWHEDILGRLGIPRSVLPPIVPSATRLGFLTAHATEMFGAPGLEVVAVCGHDTASAVAALPTNRVDAAFISSGTWSLVGAELDAPLISEEAFAYNFAMEGCAGGRWRMLRNVMGLWLTQECRLEWLRQGHDYSFEELEQLARAEVPFRCLIDPDDDAFYDPGNMPARIARRCADTGQPMPQTPGQTVRCITESLALKYRWVIEHLESVTKRQYVSIHILGGGGKDTLLDQMTADACNRPVYAGPDEAALTGNMLLQLIAHGALSNLTQGREVVARSCDIKLFEPRDTTHWDEVYSSWRERFSL